eukprot:4370520-Prymnesium_polylepis.1
MAPCAVRCSCWPRAHRRQMSVRTRSRAPCVCILTASLYWYRRSVRSIHRRSFPNLARVFCVTEEMREVSYGFAKAGRAMLRNSP